jgi:hypothetical protein
LTYIPSEHLEGPFVVFFSRKEGEQNEEKRLTFGHTCELYCADVQRYLMEPLGFASIGLGLLFCF